MNQKAIISIVTILLIIGAITGIMFMTQRSSQPTPAEGSFGIVDVPEESISVGEIVDLAAEPVVEEGVQKGQRLPNFRLRDQHGNIVELADFRGSPVVVDFWADWCPFCKNEMPALQRAHEKYSPQGLVTLGIHRESGRETFQDGLEFAESISITYPLLDDTPGDGVYRALTAGFPSMPVAFFLNSEGIVQERIFGPKAEAKIEELILKIL